MLSRTAPRHCVTCVGCTEYSLANCETVLSPTRASNPTLALKAALCRLRFAFISLLSLISSRPAKVHLNQWSNFWGPPHWPESGEQVPWGFGRMEVAVAADDDIVFQREIGCASVRQQFLAMGVQVVVRRAKQDVRAV